MEQQTIILVAGISCSGKTTLSQRLSEELRALHVSIDDYYRSFDSLALEEKSRLISTLQKLWNTNSSPIT